jgi:hypothetical protein
MNTKLSNKDLGEIQSEFDSIFSFEKEDDQIEVDANLLMAKFLSEVQKIADQNGVNRKVLASLINSSPSYLTQIFRGQKPLNFTTLAKFQRALDFKFEINIKGHDKNTVNLTEDDVAQHLDKWFHDNNNGEFFKITRNYKRPNDNLVVPYMPNRKNNFRIA